MRALFEKKAQKMDNKVHVALSVCDDTGRYGKYVATAIVSMLQNTKSHVVIHVLHDDNISEKTLFMLKETAKRFDAEILFYEVSVPSEMRGLKSLSTITIGTLFRLYLPSVCPVDKIIYIDGDVLVNIDIVKLWEEDIEDVYAAVVSDLETTRNRCINTKYYREIGFDKEKYFNAGVMYINLKRIRESFSLSDKGIEMLTKYRHLVFADQDVLNYLLAEKLKWLPEIYNYQVDLAKDNVKLPEFPCIMHFSGPVKPWECTSEEAVNKYFTVFLCTPYGEEKEEIASFVTDAIQGCARRMDLMRCILEKQKGSGLSINILLLIRAMIGNEKIYRKVLGIIRDTRQIMLYDLLYVIRK